MISLNFHTDGQEKLIIQLFIRITGDKIEDPIWKDPYEYEVVDVVIDYSSNEYYVTVKEYSNSDGESLVIPADRKEEFAHMSRLHGWEPSWERL